MHKLRAGLLALLCLGAAVGCSTQTSPGDIIAGPVALQLSVGTLNDSAGTISALYSGPGAGTYLNAVATFRNNLGASAFASPGNANLHGPGAAVIPIPGSVFGYGQPPFGAFGGGSPGSVVLGMPPAYVPASTVARSDAMLNTLAPGYPTGFIFTGAPPASGAYGLQVGVQVNGQNQLYGASASLPGSPKVLGAEAAPAYSSGGATGGGTFTVSVPSSVTETLVVVFDTSPAEVATALTHGTTATLPAGTLTAGTAYTAFAIGADYPLVEAGPPVNIQQRPTITGGGGTSNLTVSGSTGFTQ
jgi:hypothetical protein